MVQHIRNAFMDNLRDVKWMDVKTKQAAREKVTGMLSDNFNVSAGLQALSPFGRVARSHARAARERRREYEGRGKKDSPLGRPFSCGSLRSP